MTRVYCHTNEGRLANITWPTYLACRPIKNDNITSCCGRHVRRVVKITHVQPAEGSATSEYLRVKLAVS